MIEIRKGRFGAVKNNLLILGDSYSTFAGYVPDGYAIYYSEAGRPETDVIRVEETWWYQLCEQANFNLVLNNSWSGSTIGYTGYDGEDCSRTSSFIYRWRQLTEEGFFENNPIDTVIVFGGTNDSWSKAPLGEAKMRDWEDSDFYTVLPAVYYLLHLVRETLPEADIYCLINTDIHPDISACMKAACKQFGITPVTFDCINKRCRHPTVQGMKDIKNGVLKALHK